MTSKWIAGIVGSLAVASVLGVASTIVQHNRLDEREAAHNAEQARALQQAREENERALERVVGMVEKIDVNLQWLMKEFVEVRATVRRTEQRTRDYE